MKDKRLMVVLIILIAFLIMVFQIYHKKNIIITAKAAPIKYGNLISSVSAVGKVKPSEEKVVRAKLSGIIENVFVNEGDFVSRGQEVISLDTLTGTVSIKSPVGGKVILKPTITDAGASVVPGQELLTIADTSNLIVEANINEIDANSIKTGQSVKITSDALEGNVFLGRIKSVSPQIRDIEGVAKLPIKARITSEVPLIPGNKVDIEIIISNKKQTYFVPLEAVSNRHGRKIIFLVKDGAAKEHEVKTGINNLDSIEIFSQDQIKAGDRVIITNTTDISDGSKVKIIE